MNKMHNPFLRRATEYIADSTAFLSLVSPEPLKLLLSDYLDDKTHFEVPARIVGNPGSGKTMLASLVEFKNVETVLNDISTFSRKALADAMSKTGFTDGNKPLVAAIRLPMEAEYRDFWELPYSDRTKTNLVYSLLQARFVTGLIRSLLANQTRSISEISFSYKESADKHFEMMGGLDTRSVYEKAERVEEAIFNIGLSLFPPKVEDLPVEANKPFLPFDILSNIKIHWNGDEISMKPLVILDDVHCLHPKQRDLLFKKLIGRELKVARWMMMRGDALDAEDLLDADENSFGIKASRDFLDIYFQKPGNHRTHERRMFRKAASDMARRYLGLVPPLRDQGISELEQLLLTKVTNFSASELRKLRTLCDQERVKLELTEGRQKRLRKLCADYLENSRSKDTGEDVELAMLRILQHRYAQRIARETIDLFDPDPEPKKKLAVDSSTAEAGRIHLHHSFGRPFHYGFSDLCDATNENAELFLQLSGMLVDVMQVKAIGRQSPALSSEAQQKILRDKAASIIREWHFPFVSVVRHLVDKIVEVCLKETLEQNAPKGSGVNAISIPEYEFQQLDRKSLTAKVLKYGLIYGSIILVRNYSQGDKDEKHCLIELSGLVCLKHGLTLKRGGFTHWKMKHLESLIEEAKP